MFNQRKKIHFLKNYISYRHTAQALNTEVAVPDVFG
jgi:hypothetical protein